MGTHLMHALLDRPIGYRADGRPIHLFAGGSAPEGEAPPVAPPAADDSGLRAELDALKVAHEAEKATLNERLRTLMAAPPEPPVEEEGEESPPATDKAVDPELAKARKALSAATAEARKRREQAQVWEQEDRANKAALEAAAERERLTQEALTAAEAKFKPVAVKAAAVPAFVLAGASTAEASNLVRLLDLATLSVDDAGTVTGLDEQVAAVKAEFPRLFTPDTPPKVVVPRVSGGDKPPVVDAPTRSADLLARQALGGAA